MQDLQMPPPTPHRGITVLIAALKLCHEYCLSWELDQVLSFANQVSRIEDPELISRPTLVPNLQNGPYCNKCDIKPT
ncbi:hypothetical protein TorRG33x02_196280 [Trema orientale]|uniref:Uncharacterized protein n=1 Tax=Trema orientale TaxID=63057 RepID=A0A2P5EG83_TREOI|nr:hypothetical protein TorRG33x02_196280 [Trema orientale]